MCAVQREPKFAASGMFREPQPRQRVPLSIDALHKRIERHACISRNHSWSLSDDWIRLRIRRVDKTADGELGRCQGKLARVVITGAQHLA